MDFDDAEIAARIKQAREDKGLTQEQLAEMASFSTRSLQDFERGKTRPFPHLRELGELLGKPTQWFLYGVTSVTEQSEARLEAVELELAEVRQSLATLRDIQATLDRVEALVGSLAQLEALLRERAEQTLGEQAQG